MTKERMHMSKINGQQSQDWQHAVLQEHLEFGDCNGEDFFVHTLS
jgi:hypothetical protein